MIPVLSVFLIVTLSIVFTKVATVILIHTGMSREMARFQARSAFTGTGFTTNEAESMLNHPVRRRLVSSLMLLGNAGFVTAIASVMLAYLREDLSEAWLTTVVLVFGLGLLWFVATNHWLDRQLGRQIAKMLDKASSVKAMDYDSLLHLAEGYRVREILVEEEDWMAHRTLAETNLRDEGLLVLAIRRDDSTFIGTPEGDTRLEPGDTLIGYGSEEALYEIDERHRGRQGDRQHDEAVQRYRDEVRDQRRDEAKHRLNKVREEREEMEEQKQEHRQRSQEALEKTSGEN